MYAHPRVYGDKPFEAPAHSSMYSMKPYYAEDDGCGSVTSFKPLDNGPLIEKIEKLNLEDASTKSAVEDLLSRQMLLLCRLNELEAKVLARVPQSLAAVASCAVPVLGNSTSSSVDDIVIHFSLENVPYAIFSAVRLLVKTNKENVLTSFYAHSSITERPDLCRQVNTLKCTLKRFLGFEFTDSSQYLSREDRKIKFTFVATASDKALKNNEEFDRLGGISTQLKLRSSSQETFWNVLKTSTLLNDEAKLIEQLNPQVKSLSATNFLSGSSLALEDIILWSLSVEEFYPRGRKFAPCISGSQFLNPTWRMAVQNFLCAQ